MSRLRAWFGRLAATFASRRLDPQADQELRFHIEMETEAGMRRGLSRGQAEREARLRAGGVLAAR
jgi:hypothetical protein